MKKILIPIDFSENADRALAAAKLVGTKGEARLLILHAYQPYIPDMTVPSGVGVLPVPTEAEDAFRQRLEEYVAQARNEGYEAEGIWAIGGIHPAVFDTIEQYRPTMVVMGRTGTGGFLDKLIGSSTTKVALEAPCPVMIVPPQAKPKALREIVYATQLEHDEIPILHRVFKNVNEWGARLTFLKIVGAVQPNIQPDRQYIDEIRSKFDVPKASFVIREADSVLDGIEAYCDEVQADLLIVSARERSFIEAYITNPSVTKKLVVNTHVPILVYHLKDDDRL
ncbi:universal stress protein [Telluribacter sp.]|jgi:nucleotide-binding universal stress UspA family protein|uniref:universal stress protein n=1 Tax=Telluribacter sp. TaxID=1978767 RepID=UPI002E11A7A8|nr:universal stress protein [Telluribacter sp.]